MRSFLSFIYSGNDFTQGLSWQTFRIISRTNLSRGCSIILNITRKYVSCSLIKITFLIVSKLLWCMRNKHFRTCCFWKIINIVDCFFLVFCFFFTSTARHILYLVKILLENTTVSTIFWNSEFWRHLLIYLLILMIRCQIAQL